MELESKRNRERCDNYHDCDIDCGEGELGKSRELIDQPCAYSGIVGVDKEDPVGKPTDKRGFEGHELDQ